PTSSCLRSVWVSLPASPDSEHKFPPTASPESFPSAPEDDSPVPSLSSRRSPPLPSYVLPPPKPAHSSRPSQLLPSDSRTSLSFGRFAKTAFQVHRRWLAGASPP